MGVVTYHKDVEQGSFEWFQLRMGTVSGSIAKSIIDYKTGTLKDDYNKNGTLKAKTPVLRAVAKVISEIKTGMTNDMDYQSDAMLWGTEHEDEVRDMITVEDGFICGGVTNSDFKYWWLSPDYLNTNGGDEIKCPNSLTFALWVMVNELPDSGDSKVPDEHVVQVMSYFVTIPTLEEMNFRFYDPRFESRELRTINVRRADNLEYIENMTNALKEFDALVDKQLEKF